MLVGWRTSLLGWRPSLLGWRPSLLETKINQKKERNKERKNGLLKAKALLPGSDRQLRVRSHLDPDQYGPVGSRSWPSGSRSKGNALHALCMVQLKNTWYAMQMTHIRIYRRVRFRRRVICSSVPFYPNATLFCSFCEAHCRRSNRSFRPIFVVVSLPVVCWLHM